MSITEENKTIIEEPTISTTISQTEVKTELNKEDKKEDKIEVKIETTTTENKNNHDDHHQSEIKFLRKCRRLLYNFFVSSAGLMISYFVYRRYYKKN